MNIRNHCKERYAERILGIDKNESSKYAVQHDKEISEKLHELYSKSTYFWTGKVNDNPVSSFFINGDIVIVTDEQKSCLITLYKIDFGFPAATNKTVVKDLVKEIGKLNKEKDKQVNKISPLIEQKRFEINRMENEIELLKEKIAILEKQKRIEEEQLSSMSSNTELIDKDIKMFALRLVDSLAFKIDMQNMRKR